MTSLQTIADQINGLIAQRDAGADTQAAIDALMVKFEAHPEAIAIREEAAKEAAYDL